MELLKILFVPDRGGAAHSGIAKKIKDPDNEGGGQIFYLEFTKKIIPAKTGGVNAIWTGSR